jgi:aspartate oxidase
MERFPQKELENRDILAREIYRQKKVVLDLSGCQRDYLEAECPDLAGSAADSRQRSRDSPVAHSFMGGIPLNPDCSTGLGGLYVCGEVTGGLHGANRLSGSALTETAVFGRRAGRSAAAWQHGSRESAAELSSIADKLKSISELGIQNVTPLRQELRDKMWEHASLERSPEKLEILIRFLVNLEQELSGVRSNSLRQMLELRNMVATSRCVAESALRRKESLGSHYISGSPAKLE